MALFVHFLMFKANNNILDATNDLESSLVKLSSMLICYNDHNETKEQISKRHFNIMHLPHTRLC